MVHIGDHLRFGIICGPIWGSFPVWGSFAALYSTPCNCKYIYNVLEKVSRFAKFCLVLKSILFGSLLIIIIGLFNIISSSNTGIENQLTYKQGSK